VNGQGVSGTHLVSIRNISVVETTEPVVQDRDIAVGDEVLANGGAISAQTWSSQVAGTAQGTIDIVNGKYVANISDYGTDTWHSQISQAGLKIEKGATYEVKFTAVASVARNIAVDILSPDRNYDWIGGINLVIGANGTAAQDYSFTFTSSKDTDRNAALTFSLGAMDGAANGIFEFYNISVKKTAEPSSTPKVTPNAEHKGEFVINPADYGITNPVGKHIKVTAKAKSTGKIEGGVGGNSSVTNAWADGGYFVSETGAEVAISYTLEGYKDFMKIDFYYIAADVEIYDVVVTDVTPVAGQIVSPNAEHKGEFVINPADYGITNPVGKHIKVTAKAKSTGKIEGGVGGNSSVTNAWADGGYFVSETGAEVAISYTLEGYKDFMKIDFYYIAADVEIYDVVVTDVTPAAAQIVSPNAEHKGEFVIDPANYGITSPAGKHIKVTAKLKSTGKIEGAIGGNSSVSGTWAQSAGFASETGSEITVSYTLEGYVDFLKIDFWYIQADVEVYDVTVEDVTPAAAQIVSPNAEHKGEFVIDPANYGITSPAGKHIKVTAKLKSTGKIEGAIGGNSSVSGTWAQSAGFASETGSEITVSYTLEGYVDFLKIDFWYIQADVEVYAVTVEDVTPAVLGVALGEDPVVGVAAEENDEAVIAEAEDIIADPEDVLSEPEDFVVDGDTAIED
ncbi:MAG: carbohydrate binding domain-containing protein, partial [Lachnospiraceae bacterium]|nr:carbohydrate binding domain-containing protein [Lachnospiraceae bacterium]